MIYQRSLLRFLIVLLAIGNLPAVARTVSDNMRLGDKAYQRKSYDSAIVYYEEALDADRDNAMLYFKLGNAHYRLKQTGPAVLAYEKALKRRPGFAEAADNLAIAQQGLSVGGSNDDIFFVKWWKAMTRPALSNTWAIVSFIAFCFPLGMLAYSRYSKKKILWLRPQLIAGGIVLGIIAAALAIVAGTSGLGENTAVVMRPDAPFSLEAGANSKRGTITLQEGSTVEVIGKTPEYWRVSLPDGRRGNISSNYLALVD